MIIKAQLPHQYGNESMTEEQWKALHDAEIPRWRFYDNARQVETGYTPIGDIPTDPDMSAGFNWSFEHNGITEDIICGEKIRPRDAQVMLISFVDDNGPHNLYVDAPVYLLNDDGRTIERLY